MLKKSANANVKAAPKTKPDMIAKIREDREGEKSRFLTIGGAWTKEDGSLYVRFYGKQIVDTPFYLFPTEAE